MTLESFLLTFLIIWLVFHLGRIWGRVQIHVEQLEQKPGPAQANEEIITVERHHDQYLAYGHSLGFLAQGASFRDMFQVIKQRFPGKSFRIKNSQAEFTEEEAGQMLRAVFDVFGENNDRKS